MDLDEVYVHIGEFGPQQRLFFFSLAIFNIIPPFHMLQTVFTGQTPSFVCTNQNGTFLKNMCPNNLTSECSQIDFLPLPDTFAREWTLICDMSYKTKLIQSVFMCGVLVGALIFGPVADSFGRRPTLFLTFICTFGVGVAESLIPTFYAYAVVRFFSGVFTAGNMISMFVLSSELVGPSKRGLCGNIIQMFFALGIMLYSLMAYWITNWRLLSLASAGLGALISITFIWLPESPRWLIAHHRIEEALIIFRSFAISNGTELPLDLDTNIRATQRTAILNKHKNTGRLIHMFSTVRLCTITIIQLFSWFVNSVVYYGLTLASDQLGSSIYLSTALSGLVELPAYLVAAVLIECTWSGRRRTLSIFMILGGLACITFKYENTKLLALFGKLAIAASFSIIYIQSTELFPTIVRNSGLGLCSSFARIGGIVAPFISLADTISPNGQFLFLGFLSLVSGLLNLFLPETLHKPMPETTHDLEVLLGGYTPLDQQDEDRDKQFD